MNSILIPDWMLFHTNPDSIKNAMLIADEITLVVPMNGIDTNELFAMSFNSPPEDNPATAIDKVLSLANQNIIQLENGITKGNSPRSNVRKLYGIPYLLKSNKMTDLIIQAHKVIELAKEKEAIILSDFATYHSNDTITERTKLVKSEILKDCSVQVPDFSRLDFHEIANLKSKYQDEFYNAQIYFNTLSYSLQHDLKGESTDEQIKYIKGYINDTINPQMTILINSLKKSKQAKIKAILRKIAKLAPMLFTPITLFEAFGEVFNTGVDITEDFGKKEFGNEQGAFLNIMVKSYKM